MKKKLLLCMSAAVLLLLTACGIKIDTNLSVNEKFKGSRIMLCTMTKNDVKALNKNLNSLNSIIKENCPDTMTYEDQSDEEQFQYKFVITFSSLHDYKKKISECLNFAPEISYQYSSSPFANGLLYKENFTSKDLMAWFSESLVNEELMTESEVENIWSVNDTFFVFNGKSHVMDDTISIDTMEYLPLNNIQFYTEKNEDGNFKRTIVFQIPKESLDKNSKSIKQYLTDSLDSSYEIDWNSIKNGKECSISFQGSQITDLKEKTELILKTSGTLKRTVSMDKSKPLSFVNHYKEAYSLTNFSSGEDTKVNYKFYYKPASDSSLPDFEEKTEDGYYLIQTGNANQMEIAFDETHIPVFESYQMTTIYHSTSLLKRELTLHYQGFISKDEESALTDYFLNSGFSTATKDKDQTLLLITDGTATHITSAFDQVFQTKNTVSISSEKSLWSKNQSTLIKDSIDLSHISWIDYPSGIYYFISNSEESMEDIKFHSDSKATEIKRLNALEKSSVSDSTDLTEFKGAYKAKINGAIIQATYTGGITDVYGTILVAIAFTIIIIGVIIMILYRYRSSLFKKK